MKIKLTVANRQYPLSVNPEEEEVLRNAAKEINLLLKDFEEKYAVTDKQDALAMAAIQLASRLALKDNNNLQEVSSSIEKIKELALLIDSEL